MWKNVQKTKAQYTELMKSTQKIQKGVKIWIRVQKTLTTRQNTENGIGCAKKI